MKTESEWINYYLENGNCSMIGMIKLAQKESHNQAIYDASTNATAYIHCGEYAIVDSQSILKLLKP